MSLPYTEFSTLHRRRFLVGIAAGAALVCVERLRTRQAATPTPVYLSRGADGVWGFSTARADVQGDLMPAEDGVLGIVPSRLARALPREQAGVVALRPMQN
jgi:hypothetical protein